MSEANSAILALLQKSCMTKPQQNKEIFAAKIKDMLT